MPPGTPTPRSSHRSTSKSSEESSYESEKEESRSHRKRRRSSPESDSGESGSSAPKQKFSKRKASPDYRSESYVSRVPKDESKGGGERDTKRPDPRSRVRDAQEIEYWRRYDESLFQLTTFEYFSIFLDIQHFEDPIYVRNKNKNSFRFVF